MHKKAIIAMALTSALGMGGTGVAQAQQAEEPEFVGTPSVRYAKVSDGDRSFYSLAAVVRLDREITPNQTAFPVAPQLEDGQEVGDVFGGNPASSIGSPSRHCYSGELQRPQPVATPRQGARWRLGVSQGNTVQDTVSVTLKRPAEDGWEREAARRLGCYASSGSDADDGLVGERVPVRVDQLLLYEDPARSYVGSLLKGQTFKVRRLSPSGKYAYGFAYGGANKTGWVLTSGLEQQ
jgi:hypothetical protein